MVGYAVYVDGIERSKVTNPIASHVEVVGMESGRVYQIQVRYGVRDCLFVCVSVCVYVHVVC